METKNFKRALVSSGGGAMGAWGGGLSKTLHKTKEYDVYIGTSTGSMLQTLSAINKFDKLKEAYTDIETDDIFKTNPFDKNGKEKMLLILTRLIGGKLSFGDSSNLYDTIRLFFPLEDYLSLRLSGKEVISATTNLSKNIVEYKSIKEWDYEMFTNWIYASSCVYPYMNPFIYRDNCYVDGGFIEHIPIQKALDLECDEIDVIIHRPKEYAEKFYNINSFLDGLKAMLRVMHREITKDDILISKLQANQKDVKLNLYYTPYQLTQNSLMFDKKEMLKWWELGEKFFDCKDNYCQSLTLKANI